MVKKKPWARRIVFPVFHFIYYYYFFLSLLLCVIIIIRVALSLGHLSLLCYYSAVFVSPPLRHGFRFPILSVNSVARCMYIEYYIFLRGKCVKNDCDHWFHLCTSRTIANLRINRRPQCLAVCQIVVLIIYYSIAYYEFMICLTHSSSIFIRESVSVTDSARRWRCLCRIVRLRFVAHLLFI